MPGTRKDGHAVLIGRRAGRACDVLDRPAILASAAMLATALDVSQDASLTVSGGAAATTQLLYVVSGHLWLIGGIFWCDSQSEFEFTLDPTTTGS